MFEGQRFAILAMFVGPIGLLKSGDRQYKAYVYVYKAYVFNTLLDWKELENWRSEI